MTDQGVAGHGSARRGLLAVTLTTIGVVYGDIGTSPLYTIREAFFGTHPVPPTPENVLGVLSLIIYSLVIIISVKYIALVMRADNQGEGGILALTALIPARDDGNTADRFSATRPILVLLGIFGAALLYGDGMITPAISVLSAVEGAKVVTPLFEPYVVPLAVVILVGLFVMQRFGTHRVGRLFGPIMVTWFITIALLGIMWIARAPEVLTALDPRHAIWFFQAEGLHAFQALGSVLLAVTGAETMYADMGHFGKRPIRVAWFSLVLPALLLNYFGQSALLLHNVDARQPFFMLAPAWGLVPLVGLATMAAIIASQGLISGAFSLTRQAIQLGYVPRLDVEHTSSHEMGQVYVPQVNTALAIGTILIVIGFKSSSHLAAAYGIAVTMAMVITAILLYVVAAERWKWPLWAAVSVTALFLFIDLAFLGANLLKVFEGGWFPLIAATLIFTLMTTWKTGRRIMAERITARALPLTTFMAAVTENPPIRVPGTSVFMTAQPRGTPPALAHNVRYNKVLHEHVVVLTVRTARVPHVPLEEQVEVESLGHGVYNLRVQYGFMQDPNVPETLMQAKGKGVAVDLEDVTYFLGRETIIVTRQDGMATWREKLFVIMARNAVRATAYFRLPPERVVELGVQVEM
jgi:KUP system potassium uptake protein